MKQLIRRAALGTFGIGIIATGMLATAPAIMAKGGDAVIKTGNCSMSSDWKLKAKPDNGRLEVEFEVDQNRNGQAWNVTLKHNGSAFFSGQKHDPRSQRFVLSDQAHEQRRGHRHDRGQGDQPQDRGDLPGLAEHLTAAPRRERGRTLLSAAFSFAR